MEKQGSKKEQKEQKKVVVEFVKPMTHAGTCYRKGEKAGFNEKIANLIVEQKFGTLSK